MHDAPFLVTVDMGSHHGFGARDILGAEQRDDLPVLRDSMTGDIGIDEHPGASVTKEFLNQIAELREKFVVGGGEQRTVERNITIDGDPVSFNFRFH